MCFFEYQNIYTIEKWNQQILLDTKYDKPPTMERIMNVFGKLVATAALTLCASSTSFADEALTNRKVTAIGCHHGNGVCYVTVDGANFGGTLGCTVKSTNQFRFDDADSNNGKRSYASLLSAYLSGQPVTVSVGGCSAQGYPALSQYSLQ
jgi:hypothetical protein